MISKRRILDWPLTQILKESGKGWMADNATMLAAAISFFTALSLAPLLTLILTITGFFLGDEAARGQLITEIESFTDGKTALFIQSLIAGSENEATGWVATVLGTAILIWGATKLFYQLQESLNIIWKASEPKGQPLAQVARRRLVALGMTLVVAFLLLVSLAANTVASYFVSSLRKDLPGQDWLWLVVSSIVSLGVIWALFAAMYKGLPSCSVAWRSALWGAVASSLLFSAGKDLFAWYLSLQDSMQGAAGALLAVLLWVYFSSQIFFFGAEVSKAIDDRRRKAA